MYLIDYHDRYGSDILIKSADPYHLEVALSNTFLNSDFFKIMVVYFDKWCPGKDLNLHEVAPGGF